MSTEKTICRFCSQAVGVGLDYRGPLAPSMYGWPAYDVKRALKPHSAPGDDRWGSCPGTYTPVWYGGTGMRATRLTKNQQQAIAQMELRGLDGLTQLQRFILDEYGADALIAADEFLKQPPPAE